MDYSPAFKEAYLKTIEASKISDQEARRVFREEMLALGWKERLLNLYRIKGKLEGEFGAFCPNPDQMELLENRSGHDMVLKSRQIGITTLMCVYAYDRALWDGWVTGIMSHLKERTTIIFDIVQNCNDWFKKDWGQLYAPVEEASSSAKISWAETKGSVMVSYDFQSLTIKFLHVSEAAFIDEERISNSLQSVPENGEVCLESTPNGRGGFFYDQWQNWKRHGQTSPYRGHFFPWFKHYPEDTERWEKIAETAKMHFTEREEELSQLYEIKKHQIAWRRWKIAESFNNDEEKFEVHYPVDDIACFLSGENRVFSASLMKYQESFVKEPSFTGDLKLDEKDVVFTKSTKGIWKIWELPDVSTTYVMGIDCSEGIGKDSGVISVWNRNTGYQVAELRAQLSIDLLADETWKVGHFYKYAWCCPEVNNFGHSLLAVLVRKGYTKIYKRQTIDEFTNKPTQKLGFLTTVATKIPLTDNYMTHCRLGTCRVRSDDLLKEMSTFVQIGSKSGRTLRREALPGCHDDTVVAACLAWEMDKVLGKTGDKSEDWIYEQENKVKFDEDTGFAIFEGQEDTF